LLCFIDMAYWGDKDVNDFHPEIVAKYKIQTRIESDQTASKTYQPSALTQIESPCEVFSVVHENVFV